VTDPASRPGCRGTTRGTSTGRISVQCGLSEPGIFRIWLSSTDSPRSFSNVVAWATCYAATVGSFSSRAIDQSGPHPRLGLLSATVSAGTAGISFRPSTKLSVVVGSAWTADMSVTLGKTTDQKGTNVPFALRLCCEGFRYRNCISSSRSSSTRWSQVGQYHAVIPQALRARAV